MKQTELSQVFASVLRCQLLVDKWRRVSFLFISQCLDYCSTVSKLLEAIILMGHNWSIIGLLQ